MALPQSQTSTPNRQPNVSNIIEEFDPLIDRVQQCAKRLALLDNHLSGPRLVEATKDRPSPESNSVVSRLQARRIQLVDAIDDVEQAITRIEAGI